MELYDKTSYELSRLLTFRYSTSFSKSSTLFSLTIRPHIFAIYGLVRIADEIVDTYRGEKMRTLLDALERDTYEAIKVGFDTNPIIHAFSQTARAYAIDRQLIAPFFESMRIDITKTTFSEKEYESYIYGSAEVIGLMCLKVFVQGDETRYESLKPGAAALGAAYQKVNFLRDIASDFIDRRRVYFPHVTFEQFDDAAKDVIVADIKNDFATAKTTIALLPEGARKAVRTSYAYYSELLRSIDRTSASVLKTKRVRVSATRKFILGIQVSLGVFK